MEIPKGHYIFGTVKVGERGQIVIPKEARQVFDIKAGDTLIVLGDEKWGDRRYKVRCLGEACDGSIWENGGGNAR